MEALLFGILILLGSDLGIDSYAFGEPVLVMKLAG